MELSINGQVRRLADADVDPAMPLLWALRDLLGMTGTKFGCGVAACGACTVHVGGEPVRSCVTPLSAVGSRPVTTIEALGRADAPHPLQRAWEIHQVPQCGYCQSGMLMAAAALLQRNRRPSDADIDAAITNLCRCGTYPRVRAAVHAAAALMRGEPASPKAGSRGAATAGGQPPRA
jgi:isoquinoline 1-oxidoreductase alpha subunit